MNGKNVRSSFVLVAMALALLVGCGCESDADVASKNLSKAAEQFEVPRRIVFFNGITDKYLLEVQGFCSVEAGPNTGVAGSLEVICKTEDGFKKNYLGLSDNVSYFIEQGAPTKVSTTRYRVIFKPETVVPNFDRP